MAVFGKSFIYNGRSSEDFGLIIGGFQSVDTPLGLSREIMSSSMNKYRHRVNTYGVNYSNTLTFKIQLIKDPCVFETDEAMRFSRAELREITAWLTSPITPRIFHMNDFPKITYETEIVEETDTETGEVVTREVTREVNRGEPEYDYMGMFTNVTAQDNVIRCLDCTFECNTPYALSYEQIVNIQNGEGVVVNNSDDLEDYVYPVIIVTPTDSEVNAPYSIRITNETDDNRSLTLNNMKYLDAVTIDCQRMTVKNESGSLISFEDLNVDVVDYIYWPRLLSGENNIKVSGAASLQFIFRYPVKVGAY